MLSGLSVDELCSRGPSSASVQLDSSDVLEYQAEKDLPVLQCAVIQGLGSDSED